MELSGNATKRLYSVLFCIVLPFALLRLWWRGRKSPAYRKRWLERLGFSSFSFREPPLWIHAVSVGETVAASPLVRKLLSEHPGLPVIVTTMTPTGSERVRHLFGNRVSHVYAPYDAPFCVHNFLARTRPRGLVIMETELWPNWISMCRERDIPCILANGRLSARSAGGYEKFRSLVAPMLQQLSWISVQEEVHASRFVELGACEDRTSVTGSVKFDLELDSEIPGQAAAVKRRWGEARKVIVAGSTHGSEEQELLKVFRALTEVEPDLMLVLVPRHPERFPEVDKILAQGAWKYCRWSDDQPALDEVQVLLVDVMGELMKFYAAADIAYVGGSAVQRGGHNPLEPAALAVPVVMGPSVYNFQDICDQLQDSGALTVVAPAEWYDVLFSLLRDDIARTAKGIKGQEFVRANRGALERLYKGIADITDL